MSVKAEKLFNRLSKKQVLVVNRPELTRLTNSGLRFKILKHLAHAYDVAAKKIGYTPVRSELKDLLRIAINRDKDFYSKFRGGLYRKKVLINKNFSKLPKNVKRLTLAHELFHANTPVLGHSEALARLYAGAKSGIPVHVPAKLAVSEIAKVLIPTLAGIYAAKKYKNFNNVNNANNANE